MQKEIDVKVLTRVRRLMAMAAEGSGASEQEALFAAEKAREMMAEHGISTATLEASGGEGERRVQDGRAGHVGKKWMRDIMRALASQSFVTVEWDTGSVDQETGKRRAGAWRLWGRESAVVTVKLMHAYLVRTVDRTARDRNTPTDEVFKEAMGSRVAERIQLRHERAMREQAADAREKQAAARHPGSSTATNALVVVLEDYAQKERDLNEDMRLGLKPGTTALRRQEAELLRQRDVAEYEARKAQTQAERERLLAAGIEAEVVEYMLMGYSEQKALELARSETPTESEAQREKRIRREQRDNDKWNEQYRRRLEREAARLRNPSYRAGRAAGDSVGLDSQVDRTERRKLT